MAWDRKTTRDDINHPKPVKLPPNGYGMKPEQRAAAEAAAAVNFNQRSDGFETWHVDGAGNEIEGTRKQVMEPTDRLDMHTLAKEIAEEANISRIDRIKDIARKLTYGEMMELAQTLAEAMPSGTVDKDAFKLILPPTLHAWAIDGVARP